MYPEPVAPELRCQMISQGAAHPYPHIGGLSMLEQLRRALEDRPVSRGISPSDIISLPEPLSTTLGKMLRRGKMSLAELAAELGLPLPQARELGELMVSRGIVTFHEGTTDTESFYRVITARAHGRSGLGDLLKPLDDL